MANATSSSLRKACWNNSCTKSDIEKLASITASAVEINKLAGVTAGTATAGKAVVLGVNKELDQVHTAALYLGSGAGTQITATATEINKLAGSGAIVASGTQASKINDPTGGTTVDTEARTAIGAIIDALEAFGISASS
jgi:hypothetical protein